MSNLNCPGCHGSGQSDGGVCKVCYGYHGWAPERKGFAADDVNARFNRPPESLNLRRASQLSGIPVGENGEEGLYARVGVKFGVEGTVVTDILVSDDGLGPTGFYTRVTVWADEILLGEFPLHNLEGVIYA